MKYRYLDPLRLTVALMTCVLLSSCAVTGGVNFAPTVTSDMTLEPNTGYIAIVTLDASTAPLPFNYLTINPKNVNVSDDIKPIRLQSVANTPNHSMVFFSRVPAGEYSFADMYAFHSAQQGWYSRWGTSPNPVGTFKVSPGKITDLGKIVLYPKVSGDRYHNIILRIPGSTAVDDIPPENLQEWIATNDILTWDDDGKENERQSLYANIAQNPIDYNTTYYSELGNFYIIGKLGFILKRDPHGSWFNDAVDTDFELTAIHERTNGDLFAGGEYGQFFTKSPHEEWVASPLPEPMYVDKILSVSDTEIHVVAHNNRNINIYSRTTADLYPSWKKVAYLDPRTGWKNIHGDTVAIRKLSDGKPKTYNISGVSVIEFNKRIFISARTQSGRKNPVILYPTKRTLFSYDTTSYSFLKVNDLDDGLDVIIPAGDSYIGVKGPTFWRSWSTYSSYDTETHTWSDIAIKANICSALDPNHSYCKNQLKLAGIELLGVPIFGPNNTAYAFVKLKPDNRLRNFGKSFFAVASNDSGKHWHYSDTPFPGDEQCIDTIADIPGKILVFCRSMSSDIYESSDMGQTWQHVRESVKF